MKRIAVSGTRNPELKPYRVMSAGLDAFDEFKPLAPNASLQFKLSRRGDPCGYKANWDGVSMRLAGNDTSIPIPISADGTFSLPRSKEAYDDEADLVLIQKKDLIRFQVDVRTPGLPANVRRMGDLRLQCQVVVAIGRKELNVAQRAAFNTLMLGADWCTAKRARFGFAPPGWSMGTTIVHDGKRTPYPADGYRLNVPLYDKTIPDDALVESEFWSTLDAERKQQLVAAAQLVLKSSFDKWKAGPALSRTETSATAPSLPGMAAK